MHIHLMHRSLLRRRNSQQRSHCHHLRHRSERLGVVDSFHLCISQNNEARLKSFHRSISVVLGLVHPLTTERFLSEGQLFECPRSVQRTNFGFHRLSPMCLTHRIGEASRFCPGCLVGEHTSTWDTLLPMERQNSRITVQRIGPRV